MKRKNTYVEAFPHEFEPSPTGVNSPPSPLDHTTHRTRWDETLYPRAHTAPQAGFARWTLDTSGSYNGRQPDRV